MGIKSIPKRSLINILKPGKMKKLSELTGFKGTDISNEISLFEYGLLCKDEGEEGIHCLFGVTKEDDYYTKFNSGWISQDEIVEKINEKWFDKKAFFSYLGTKERYWLCFTFIVQISDLLSYYGYENIFGSSQFSIEIENDC